MNRAVLMGRLTKDPEVRYTRGEQSMAVAEYTLAVNRRGKRAQEDGQEADFILCTAFDKAGEFAEKYFRKGMRVLISGRIRTDSYMNQERKRVYITRVIADEQEFADSRNPEEGEKAGRKERADREGFMNIPDSGEDEGIPFV